MDQESWLLNTENPDNEKKLETDKNNTKLVISSPSSNRLMVGCMSDFHVTALLPNFVNSVHSPCSSPGTAIALHPGRAQFAISSSLSSTVYPSESRSTCP